MGKAADREVAKRLKRGNLTDLIYKKASQEDREMQIRRTCQPFIVMNSGFFGCRCSGYQSLVALALESNSNEAFEREKVLMHRAPNDLGAQIG